MFALNPRLATWLATLLFFTFSACEKDDAILAPSEVLPPISSQTNQPSNSLSAVAIEAVREEFKNLTRKAQILRFNTTKNLTNEDELITSLDFQPLWYAATSTQLLDEEVIVVPVLPPMSETYDEYQGYKMLIYPEEDSHRFGVVYYESVEPELGSAEGFNGMITMIAEDGPVSIYGLVEQDLLTHMGFYDQNDDYITLDLSSTQKCGILRFLRALFGSGVNCYQFPRRRSAGGSSGSSGSGAWGSGGGGASDVFGGGLTGWFTVYSTGGGSGGSTGSTLYGGGSGEGRDGRSVSGIFVGENTRDSESCQSNIQQTYRPVILGGSLGASDDPLEVPAFALMLHYGADWLDYFLSAHTIWTQNGHQDLMGVFQQVEGGQVVNHFNGVHPVTEDAYTTLDDFAIISTNMQTDYEHSIANCRMPRYTILDAMLELTSGFCESAMDQFESEFQITLSEEEWNELFSTMEEVPPCGDQEAFEEWVRNNYPETCLENIEWGDLNENGLIDKIREHLPYFRIHGYGWFADMIEELIECPGDGICTYGDFYDLYQLVKSFYADVAQEVECARDQRLAEWMMAIFSPDNVGTILSFALFETHLRAPFQESFRRSFSRHYAALIADDLARGFNSHDEFVATYGPAGAGKEWHHIVEQHVGNVTRFGPRNIHHPNNYVAIDVTWHREITAIYNSSQPWANNGIGTVREFVKTLPFKDQFEWGLEIMRMTAP